MSEKTSLTAVRRSDRAITDERWIRAFLRGAPVGVLATVYEGQPFLTPNVFVYDEEAHCLYLHTARTGRTRSNVEYDGPVCFSVMEMGRLLPAEVALEFGMEYASVIVFGRASIVLDDDEATRALQELLDKYAPHLHPGRDYRPPITAELKRTSVFRIDIDAWSAKMVEVEEDFPGAYWYPEQPVLKSLAAR